MKKHIRWTPEEDQIIKNYWFQEGSEECQKRLPHRTESGIRHRASKLGIKGKMGVRCKDISGQLFGRWVEITYDEKMSKLRRASFYKCICTCGNINSVSREHLTGDCPTLSCGCFGREESSKRMKQRLVNLTGKRYGRGIIQSYNAKKSKEKGQPHWNLKCDCGNTYIARGSSLKRGSPQSCGCLKSELTRERMLGVNNPNYTDGSSPLAEAIRKLPKYKLWRAAVFERDNYTCQYSRDKLSKNILVHHINSFAKILRENNITNTKEARRCRELWDIDNGIVLSEEWHKGVFTPNFLAFHRLYGNSFTKQDFYKWIGRT